MPRKRDDGGNHADRVVGVRDIVKCLYCGEIVHGEITRLMQHFATTCSQFRACSQAPLFMPPILNNNFNEGSSERVTMRRRKASIHRDRANGNIHFTGEQHNLHYHDCDESGISGEDLSYMENLQLRQAMEESLSMARVHKERSKCSTSRTEPVMSGGGASVYGDLPDVNFEGDEDNIGEKGLSELEKQHLKQAMRESRLVALKKGRYESSARTAYPSSASWSELGNARLEEDVVHAHAELRHQRKKDKEDAQTEHEVQNLLLENEKLMAKVDELKKMLEEKEDELQDMEALNQTLILKERMSNLELQDARKVLIRVLPDIIEDAKVGVKRMGEVNLKPFQDYCLKKFSSAEWEVKSVEANSLWQDKVNDPNWQPFKKTCKDGKWQETINDDDDELKELRRLWGKKAYDAVADALLDLNEYNPSGRYVVPELWNREHGRKASLPEAIQCLIQELMKSKPAKRRRQS